MSQPCHEQNDSAEQRVQASEDECRSVRSGEEIGTCDDLGVSVADTEQCDEVQPNAPKRNRSRQVSAKEMGPESHRMAELYERLDEADRAAVLAMVERLARGS